MTALAARRGRAGKTFKRMELTLTSGKVAYQGGSAVLTGGEVRPATSTPNELSIGLFFEDKDATSAAKTVTVELHREIYCEWRENATSTDAIVAGDIGKLCYFADDQTVGILSGRTIAGRIWKVDSTKGVLVEPLGAGAEDIAGAGGIPAVGAFVATDYAPTALENGAVYDIPTTAAASTVTLPAAAANGTKVFFVADGTKNGHTVTYRDATGTVALTTALVASKRHEVVCVKRDSKWYANAYVSP
jgi:hypothetical protein